MCEMWNILKWQLTYGINLPKVVLNVQIIQIRNSVRIIINVLLSNNNKLQTCDEVNIVCYGSDATILTEYQVDKSCLYHYSKC